MEITLHWFFCLCLERDLLEPASLAKLLKSSKLKGDPAAYGEMMLDLGIVPDRKLLQSLLGEASDRAKSGGTPPFHLFSALQNDPASAAAMPPPPEPAPESPPPSLEEPPPERGSGKIAVPIESGKPGLPDFSALEGATDAVLREAMIGLLRYASESGASDLHLSAGARPFVRRDRENHYLDSRPLTPEAAEGLNRVLLSDSQWAALQQRQDLDFALPFSSGERYRTNLMIHKDGCAGTYRTVPSKIKSLAELGFRHAKTIDRLLSYHNGLIIVAGPVGSGKTTTLAALVQQLNQTRDDHLISVEEPIEVVHSPGRCVITQRGVGEHTQTFHSALKGALRQDPDIIVIGEMRDLETVEMAISASETGHLVIGTMHTSDAATTLNRILDVFPPAQQPQIRAMVAESLRGIICQRLLPSKGGGVVLASEILLRNLAVSSLIRDGKIEGLGNVIETGKADGMMTMESSVLELWREGKLSDETALANIKSEAARREIRRPAPAPAPAEHASIAPKKRGLFSLSK